jgi:AcrR family transcriptional regulator
MRTVKEPEIRRTELMNAAEELFGEKGVDQTSVNDIILRAGVAKGTFYWYFKSKDELLDSLVDRRIESYASRIEPVIGDNRLNAVEKLRQIVSVHNAVLDDQKSIHDFFHRTENALTHQKHLIREMQVTSPMLSKVVSQGIAEGLFDTGYPREIAEFMLLSLTFLAHPSVFQGDGEDRLLRFKALQEILERALRVGSGTFNFLDALLGIGESK